MKTGIVLDMPEAEYHGLQALSASGIWDLADCNQGCPARYFDKSPFNPDREQFNAVHFDVGKAAHLAVLEPDRLADRVVLHGHDKYQSNAAKAVRDGAYAAGRIPLTPRQWSEVEAMREAIMNDPLARGAFSGEGQAEVTALWTDPVHLIPCKARADRVIDGGRILVDLKTARSAHRLGFSRAIWDYGYFCRADWYLRGWEYATGRRPDGYLFIVIESKSPHLSAVHKLPEVALEWGAMINQAAMATFAGCMNKGEWPSYRLPGFNHPRAFVTGLPRWAEYLMHDLAEAGGFNPPKKLTAADVERGARLYAPDHPDDEDSP